MYIVDKLNVKTILFNCCALIKTLVYTHTHAYERERERERERHTLAER